MSVDLSITVNLSVQADYEKAAEKAAFDIVSCDLKKLEIKGTDILDFTNANITIQDIYRVYEDGFQPEAEDIYYPDDAYINPEDICCNLNDFDI